MFLAAEAREGDAAFDHGPRLCLLQGTGSPQLRGLAFDGHARRVAHETIRVTEMRPGFVDGLGAGALFMQAFEFEAQLVFGSLHRRGSRRGARFALIGHAIKRRLRAPSADGKIHCTIPADDGIGERQGFARDELLKLRVIARAFRREMHGVERAVGPVAGVDGVLILCRKQRSEPGDDARRTTRSHLDKRRHNVRAIAWQLARGLAEAVVAAADDVVNARGSVPRRAGIPLHVTVIGEEIAQRVERGVEVIAHAVGDHLEAFAVRRNLQRDGMRLGVVELRTLAGARHDLIIGKGTRAARVLDLRLSGAIAAGEIQALSIGRERDAVIAVFTLAFDLAQQRLLIELARALGVAQAIQTRDVRFLVHERVEAVEGIKQTVRAIDPSAEFLHLRLVTTTHGRRCESEQTAVLIGRQNAALVIDGEPDP